MQGASQTVADGGAGEPARLQALACYEVLDTPPDEHFDALARLAARLCNTPMAVITLVDDHRQWFKSEVGVHVRETPRAIAFCAHTIEGTGLFQVPDAQADARFVDNPLVTGELHLRFYAGFPLQVEGGHRIGALAVLDRRPRQLTPQELSDLESLARQVVVVLEERRLRIVAEAASAQAKLQSDSWLMIAGRVARLGAWELDIAREKVAWSDVVADIHGMPSAHSPQLDEALSYYVEPDRSTLAHAVAHCLQDGVPFDHELVLQPAGGGDTRWVRSIGEAVRDAEGRITHLRGACQDITERKSHLLQIQRLADRLTATLESIPDPFFAITADWQVQLVNAAFERLVQRSRPQLLGRSLPEVLPTTMTHPQFFDQCLEAMKRQRPVEFEALESQSGRRFEVRVFPIEEGLTIHARDITERKLAEMHRETLERQLRQAQKMESIGTLAGGIAHDFNNILGTILGNVTLVQDALPPKGAAHIALATISASAQRARSLVQQILAFGRLQATQRLRQPLRPLINEVAQLLQSTLPANVVLEARCPLAEVFAEIDANHLQQVLINLCTNAWHAMPASGGRIVIGLDEPGRDPLHADAGGSPTPGAYAHLWVKDDGCGIDPEVQSRIFEPFFTTKPVGQGTGLGLSAAHGIVVAHGGTISVESEPTQGSMFHIYLPACAAPAPDVATKPNGSARPARLDGLRVLCVDDDPMMLTTMQALLEREGCRVDALLDAQQALERLQSEPAAVDLLVTDYNMPGMDGLALVQAAKRLSPALPVVMASGFLSDKLCEQATQLGVQALVQKERTVEDLMMAVREVVRR